MDQCRHDGIAMDYIDVTCYGCTLQDGDLIDSLRAQRDAAEKRAAQLLCTAKYIAMALRSLRHVKLDGIAEQYGLRTNGDWLGLFLDATDAHVQALGELATQRERAAAAEKRAAAAELAVEKLLDDSVGCCGPVRRCGSDRYNGNCPCHTEGEFVDADTCRAYRKNCAYGESRQRDTGMYWMRQGRRG